MAALRQKITEEQLTMDGSQRRCIVSGLIRPKDQLLRFVAGPDGQVVPDFAGTLPGRGLWVMPERDLLERACAKNFFTRAARKPLKTPEDFVGRLEALARKRCLADLSMARRAGQLAAGLEKVKERISSGRVGVLCQAVDGAREAREKLWNLTRAKHPACRLIEVFDAEEMGKALGWEPRVHVALDAGPLAERFILDSLLLRSLRGDPYEDLVTA